MSKHDQVTREEETREKKAAYQNKIITFSLDKHLYGLPLSSVERILRIVAVTPLPKAPEVILGIINLHGTIIPVLNIRCLFGLTDRETGINEQIIIARTNKRKVALIADEVREVINLEENYVNGSDILPSLICINGVLKSQEDLILITNLENCLSMEEDLHLEEVLRQETGKDGKSIPD